MFAVPVAAPVFFGVLPILDSCTSVKTLYCTENVFAIMISQRCQGSQIISIFNF